MRNEEDNTLTAAGTSLGADDGAGCALAMAAAEGLMAHGPLRIIITADEEKGMSGALGLSAEWPAGAAYLINLGSEVPSQVLVSTAADDSVTATLNTVFGAASGDLALAREIYREQNGEEIEVVAVHASPECGTFAVLNPALDMISIGPDLTDVHTTGETFRLDTLPRVWRLPEGLLAGV